MEERAGPGEEGGGRRWREEKREKEPRGEEE